MQVKQATAGVAYDHPLTVEYFAVGEEAEADNFVLLDRKSATFVPTEAGKGTFEFLGDREVAMVLQAAFDDGDLRGSYNFV